MTASLWSSLHNFQKRGNQKAGQATYSGRLLRQTSTCAFLPVLLEYLLVFYSSCASDIISFVFGGGLWRSHTLRYPGFTSGNVLRNHFGWCSGYYMVCWGQNKGGLCVRQAPCAYYLPGQTSFSFVTHKDAMK